MSQNFAAAIAAVAESSPMGGQSVPVIAQRTLRVDGDGLAYYVAGNDDTLPGYARRRLIEKVEAAQIACGAGQVEITATAPSSHKGHRYAIARVKPYQGQRKGHHPKNWQYLRDLYNEGQVGNIPVTQTTIAEADDLLATPGDTVIYSQDKDMRMIPGIHLDWKTHLMLVVPPGTWEIVHDEKVYGRKWFWLQLLHGDTVDNIPGLPKFREFNGDGSFKEKRIGEVTAGRMLAEARNEGDAAIIAKGLYRSYYGDRWLVEMLEQGMLLWLRRNHEDVFDIAATEGPFARFTTDPLWPSARAEIQSRIDAVEKMYALKPRGAHEDVPGEEPGSLQGTQREGLRSPEAESAGEDHVRDSEITSTPEQSGVLDQPVRRSDPEPLPAARRIVGLAWGAVPIWSKP